MRNKNEIEKEHAKNKRVRKEKARLRKRGKKKKSRFVWMTITGLEFETISKLRLMAKENHTSVSKLLPKLLSKYIKEVNNVEV